jgi:hypothetical protein
MPVLWWCVGMCGTGIGVVFQMNKFCHPMSVDIFLLLRLFALLKSSYSIFVSFDS